MTEIILAETGKAKTFSGGFWVCQYLPFGFLKNLRDEYKKINQ